MKYQAILNKVFPNFFLTPLGSRPWGDFQGALAGALTSIPQVLAYGLIIGGALGGALTGAGMLIALYGAVVLGMFAVLLGGCPYLVTAPRAPAMLVFAALIVELSHSAALSHSSSPAATALALACMAVFLSGLLQVAFSMLRLGKMVSYIPLPVMQGFINGSALLIILSQLGPALGLPEQGSALELFKHLGEIKPAALLLALGTAALVRAFPRLTNKIPPLPLAFVAGTLAYHAFAFLGYGVAMGGTLPPPPEDFSVHSLGWDDIAVLANHSGVIFPVLAASVSMALLSTLDTLLAVAATDEVTQRRSDANRQLMAEGVGNAIAALFGMVPGSGSLARTKAAIDGGMNSAMAPLGVSLITLVTVLVFATLIGQIPQAVMAGLLLALGLDLLDKPSIMQLLKIGTSKASILPDLLVAATVVATALLYDLKTAVGIGVLLSIISFVAHMSHNPIRRSYRATALIPRLFGDVARHRFIEAHGRKIAIIEMEGAVFFGTVSKLVDCVDALAREDVCHVVLDLRRVKHIDSTGAKALAKINEKLESLDGMLLVSHVERERRREGKQFEGSDRRGSGTARKVWMTLADFGTVARLGAERFQSDTDSAVLVCEKHLAGKLAMDKDRSIFNANLVEDIGRPRLRRLRKYLARVNYQAGETVFRQGNKPDGVFFIASGRVDVVIDLPGVERKKRIQSLTSGSIFGEMALIDVKPRSASAIVAEPMLCYFMSMENFERLKQEHADIAFSLLSSLATVFAERLRATNAMLAEMEV